MIESFVDLTYRGLPLGRRIKLTQVRPSVGYLELPAPMPVGTTVQIATDEGVAIDAVVTQLHEQVGGSEHTPGMQVRPALAEAAAAAWWQARVGLPEVEIAEEVTAVEAPVVQAPAAEAPAAEAPVVAAAAAPDARATMVMPAIDQEALEQLARPEAPDLEALSAPHAIIDDGKATTVMAAIDPAALGLDMGGGDDDDKPKPAGATGTVKKRRKRR